MIPIKVFQIVWAFSVGGSGFSSALLHGYVGRREEGTFVAWQMGFPGKAAEGASAEEAMGAFMLRHYGTFIDKPVQIRVGTDERQD